MTIFLKYIGRGKGSIPGVPARDLTKAETDAHGGEFRLVLSGLYVRAIGTPAKVEEIPAAGTEAAAETDEKPKRRNRRAKE